MGKAKREANQAADAAEQVTDSPAFEGVARGGYAANGLMHLLIGFLALRIAAGGSGEADQSGAVGQLAAAPGGVILLWVCCAGCAALALWQLSEAFLRWRGLHGGELWKNRSKAVGQAIVYGVLAWTFGLFAAGGRRSSGSTVRTFSASLMQDTAGKILLVAIGLVVIGIGVYYVIKGIRQKFRDTWGRAPSGTWGTAVVALGTVGYIAKGIALAVVGLLFIVATANADPKQSSGLDGALKALQAQPYGWLILGAVGVGLMCYGLFSMARARYEKM